MASAEDWRAKYLSALDKQEALENKLAAYGDILRRVVVNLGAASYGLDKQVDASVGVLKGYLKTAGGQKVFEQLRVVEAAVQEFDERRGRCHQALSVELQSLVEHLLTLNVPSDTYALLKGFSRELKTRPTSFLVYPDLIRKLNAVHAKVIAAAAAPEQSIWQRLRGGKRLQAVEGQVLDARDLQGKEEFEEAVSASDEELSPETLNFDALRSEIHGVLTEVLGAVQASEESSPKLQAARLRIENGIEPDSLLETLEDLRDVLCAGFVRYDSEFSEYLARVNTELSAICEALGLGVQKQQEHMEAAHTFGQVVSEQMNIMESAMAGSDSLEELKKDIAERIRAINEALVDFQKQQQSSHSLSEELAQLNDRVRAIESESTQAKALLEQERHRALHDPLTELPNREAYNERAAIELKRVQEQGDTLCLAVCDIDHFKQFNDRYGHQVGDRVLKLIAKALRKRLRAADFVARFGGEEFVIFLPRTEVEAASTVLDKIRQGIAASPFRVKQDPVKITLSFGVTELVQSDTIAAAFARADKALYQAKDAGRNCVRTL